MAKNNKKTSKTMEDYHASRKKLNTTARFMAIVMIGIMIAFTFISAMVMIIN